MEEIIPVHVQRCIHSLVDITNPGSHRTKIDSDVASGKTPYLLRTLIYEMLHVLCWGKVLNTFDDPETVRKAIDIAKYNYEKKVEERKNNKNGIR